MSTVLVTGAAIEGLAHLAGAFERVAASATRAAAEIAETERVNRSLASLPGVSRVGAPAGPGGYDALYAAIALRASTRTDRGVGTMNEVEERMSRARLGAPIVGDPRTPDVLIGGSWA
jgi:hypothetical protein